MKRVVVFGGGRMGRRVFEVLAGIPDAELAGVVALKRPDWLDEAPWFNDLGQLEELPDLLIDFTLPQGTRLAAAWCRANLVPLVSGTTGLEDADREALRGAAELIPVLWAPNLSKGVNLLLRAVVETAASLPADTPVEITDLHHAHKKDSPSGTALLLAKAVAAARDQRLADCLRIVAAGDSPDHGPGSISCISRREGEAVGLHRVRFICPHERLELVHSASDRDIYASGAIEAGLWLVEQKAGLYSAANWLGT